MGGRNTLQEPGAMQKVEVRALHWRLFVVQQAHSSGEKISVSDPEVLAYV